MITETFRKPYRDPQRARSAQAHRAWLAALDCGVRLPELISATPHELEFEHLGHHQPGADDLAILARTLGQMHAAAHTQQLHSARLDTAFTSPGGMLITDFVTPRHRALASMPLQTEGLPVAFYKDSNLRNFLLTHSGPAVIDFDDLTLAPFGYDLAKLIVSIAMTHGHLDPQAVENALDIYNAHTATSSADTACHMSQLRSYTEFHHLCTARYQNLNGYRHTWPDSRPWPLS